ncbi:hypothetical protein [Sphingomonas sp.]|nr:hypothetical protein [Sphingomonas sp.]HWK35703.1 hypothetical protein [Sphingomonas sp.]
MAGNDPLTGDSGNDTLDGASVGDGVADFQIQLKAAVVQIDVVL